MNALPTVAKPGDKPPFARLGVKMRWPGHGGAIDYGMIAEGSDSDQEDGQATLAAIEIMDRVKDRPFFLAVGYRRPHAPFVAPKAYFEPFPLEEMRLPNPGDRSDVTPLAFPISPPNYGEPEAMKQMKRAYLASVSYLDAEVGRLLEALETRGLSENTIVVFVSDHGFHLGEHGNWHKFSLFEESARAPLFIRAPGVSIGGSRTQGIVELIDLFPTLAQLSGLPEPQQSLDGKSLVPLLEKPDRADWKGAYAITQVRRNRSNAPPVMGYSIRTDDFRYNEWWAETQPPRMLAAELYDLNQDPEEEFNRVEFNAYQKIQAELSDKLKLYLD